MLSAPREVRSLLKDLFIICKLEKDTLNGALLSGVARDNGSAEARRAAPSSWGFRAEVLPSLTNAFYVFSRDYFARSATPDTSRERACLQTSLWQMATESGRVRLRRDPRGNPTERSIPEFLLERRVPAFSTVVTLASFPCLSQVFPTKIIPLL